MWKACSSWVRCSVVGAELAGGGALLALLQGEVPVDAAVAAAAQGALQLVHQRGDARRVVRAAPRPRPAGSGSIDDLPAQDVAEHVPEFVFGVLTLIGSGVVGHFRHLSVACLYASPRTPAMTGKCPRLEGSAVRLSRTPLAATLRIAIHGRSTVALFTDDHTGLHGQPTPPARAPAGSCSASRSSPARCSAIVPSPYVIEQPGPVFNTLGIGRARRRRRGAADHDPGRDDLPDRGQPRHAHRLGGRQPATRAELARGRRRLVRPEQGRAAARRGLPADVTTEQRDEREPGRDGRLAAGGDRRGADAPRLRLPDERRGRCR